MVKITMPQAGQTMEEGQILSWRKREGEEVSKGEILFEIETDKATVEVESSDNGVLKKILCPEGAIVPIHAPVAVLGAEIEDIEVELRSVRAELKGMLKGNDSMIHSLGLEDIENGGISRSSTDQETLASPPAEKSFTAVSAPPDGFRASPAAKKTALEKGVRIEDLPLGSGPGGRILSGDVERFAANTAERIGPVRRPLTGMRRAIARNLLLSKQSIPHFYMRLTIDAGRLWECYRNEKAKYPCSLNDLIVFHCARVLREFPAFRSRIEGEEIVEYPTGGIGIAVGTDDGLRVPVIANAGILPLRDLAAESRRIIEAAQKGKLEGVGPGLLTISNLGMFGVEEFSAIINPPEASILAVAAIREAVLVKDGAIRAGRCMTITLSADHRVVDGLMAAKFLARLKDCLESPENGLE